MRETEKRRPVVAIIAHGTIPASSSPATGIGLRAWSLAEGLRQYGFDVHLCLPEGADNAGEGITTFNNRNPKNNINSIIKRISPDVVIAVWWEAAEYLAAGNFALVLDCPAPLVLERFYLKQDSQELAIRKITVFSKADLIVCSNRLQESYFQPWLMLAGRPDVPITEVPIFTLQDKSYTAEPFPERTLIYAGVFWPWQNAEWALNIALEEFESAGKGKLIVVGGANPFRGEFAGRETRPALKESQRLEWKSMLPYPELMKLYSRCHGAMQVFEPNKERKLSSSFRLTDALTGGLPVFVTSGLPFSNLVSSFKAGWEVDFGNESMLRESINSFLSDDLEPYSKAAVRLASERFSAESSLPQLVKFCRNPVKQPPPENWTRKVDWKEKLKASPVLNSLLKRFS